ncbi:MAG: DNA cytosine methyltransferase [Chloroflexi bacterium]|nr:DNA cytosine methyltransferase [Chloroflexota bacterium]
MVQHLTAVDLFAGAGGLSLGFRNEGFDVRFALDNDPWAAETYARNHPETPIVCDSIQSVAPEEVLDRIGVQREALTVLIGGPPCQDFSINNHRRGQDDRRAGLVQHYLSMVAGLRPRFVLMENVTGLLSANGGHWVEVVYESLSGLGYQVDHRILSSEDYGVPQRRRRVFFIGARDRDEFSWPTPTHRPEGRQRFVTVDAAIGDLPAIEVGGGAEEMDYDEAARAPYQRDMRKWSRGVFNHVAPALGARNRERIRFVPPGGSWRDIPFELLPPGMQRARRGDHTKRYGRLHPEGLAATILTKCDPHWGAYIHPDQDRTLTVRETARLQSFPDRFLFCGPRLAQARQVGNAVPPLVANRLARSIVDAA